MRRKPLTQNQRKRRERKVFSRQTKQREELLKILLRKFKLEIEVEIPKPKQSKQTVVYDNTSEEYFALMHERKHLRRTLILKKFLEGGVIK